MTPGSFRPRTFHTFLVRILGGARAPSPAQVERTHRRVLQRLRQDPMWTSDAPPFEETSHSRRAAPVVALVGTAAAIAAMIAVVLIASGVMSGRRTVAAAESGESALSVSADGESRALQANEPIAPGDIVRSNGAAGGMLRLTDGSRVEMRAHSELSLERADDGVRIRLSYGGIIVSAAAQREGHLYVQTKDFVVSVVGTVFLVDAEKSGSRVAVIEGEVRVQQGDTDQRLRPGQQVMTSALTTAPVLPQEIAWSRNASVHLARLQQSAQRLERFEPDAERATPQPVRDAAGQASVTTGAPLSRFLAVNVVTADVVVRDASGLPVLDLGREDFALFDEGEQQTVESAGLVNRDGTTYYLLSYRTPALTSPGRFRRIRVLVDRPDVRVEARAGYYPNRPFGGVYPEDEPGLVAPVLRERHEPTYPFEAISGRIQGNVVVEAVVGVDGRVSRTYVVPPLSRQRSPLDDAARDAVSRWTFTPGELRGERVPVLMRLVVTFRLN